MICLIYRNELERTMALASIASRCRQVEARLVFIGSETCCDNIRKDIHNASSEAMDCLEFRPVCALDEQACRRESFSWEDIFKSIQSVILEYASMKGSIVGWIDIPLPQQAESIREVLRLHQSLGFDTESLQITPISTFRLNELTESASHFLLEDQNIVLNASFLASHYPSWIMDRIGAYSSASGKTPHLIGQETAEEMNIKEMLQLENQKAHVLIAAGIAHELGNPLSIINSSLQYLHEQLAANNDPASDFTRTALKNIDRMHEILRNMLDFSTLRKSPRQQTDLNEVISEMLRFTSTECKRRMVKIEASLASDLPSVWINPSEVKQIILNLVCNELDAVATSGDRLIVRTRVAPDRIGVIIEVENNGPRIPEEFLPRLFRPFFTTKDGGTGLGLYLSRQIARDHGGDLEVENLPDGVRFVLRLPLRRQKECGDGQHLDC